MSNIEQTLSIIKPDAVERNLESEIKKKFINSGFKIPKEKKPNFLLNENDIVFARTGGTVGKSYLIKNDVPSAVFASYLIRVVLTEHTDPQLIHFFFQSVNNWAQVSIVA